MLKSIVNRCLQWTPYELRRRTAETLPPATFDNISLALAYYLRSDSTSRVVQVGACDGVSGDPLHPFFQTGRMRAVVVEPVEASFLKLRQVYAAVPEVTAVNAAIGRQDGRATLFKVRAGARSLDPYWAQQLASFDREHLRRHGVAAEEIEAVEVPCLTLRTLLQQCQLEAIDVLQIDTEGFDAEVVKMALELSSPPECINFENEHLGPASRREVFERLESEGYVWTHDKWNTLALHARLLERWARIPGRGSGA